MSARTSVGVGVGSIITVLGISTVALFVLTFVFLGQKQGAEKQLGDERAKYAGLVREGEIANPDVRRLIDEATKSGKGKSGVGYLLGSFREVAEKVNGDSGATPVSLVKSIDQQLASGGSNLVSLLADRQSQIAQLNKRTSEAESAAAAAREELETLNVKAKATADAQAATNKQLIDELNVYKGNVDRYSGDVQKRVQEMTGSIDKIKREAGDETVRLNDQITRLNQELIIARGKIEALTAERRRSTLRPGDEASLVDGEVVGEGGGASEVFINRGQRQRVVLGMTFEVYADSTQLRPDADGNYPRGKGSLEVIRVEPDSSVCRITRSVRGQPVVRGDVIASAVYDPAKIYSFMVYGNFDTRGDSVPTPAGQAEIKALVESWGGKIADTFTGDIDFLVLGARPVMPLQPPVDAPVAQMQEFVRQKRAVQEYDRLLSQAIATQIPVLNQNRLYTLIGK